MLLAGEEFIVPRDDISFILEVEGLSPDLQPAWLDQDLLDKRVAITTAYEYEDSVRYHGAVQIGRVSLVDYTRSIIHISQREVSDRVDATLVVPEWSYVPIITDEQLPNFTELLPVRALFYVLPHARPARA